MEEGILSLNNTPLTLVKENTYTDGKVEVAFAKHNIQYILPRRDTIVFTAVRLEQLNDKAKVEYLGEYFSEDAACMPPFHPKDTKVSKYICFCFSLC